MARKWAWRRNQDGAALRIPEGKGGILITLGAGGPEGIDFQDRPASRVVADLLICADSLSREIEEAVARAAGITGEHAPSVAAEALLVGELLEAARKVALEVARVTASRVQLAPVARPVDEQVVG